MTSPESSPAAAPDVDEGIRARFSAVAPFLDERQRRLVAASEVLAAGSRSISLVQRSTGVSRQAIRAGLAELADPTAASSTRVRRPGGGRKALKTTDPTLLADLESLIEPVTRGDPESAMRWVSKSTRHLLKALQDKGHAIGSPQTVATLLQEAGYTLQAPVKTMEGGDHPDRNAQFEYVYTQMKAMQAQGQPVISVDAKKRELVGNFYNKGQEWHPLGEAPEVKVYDFVDPVLGKATPYGVYDVSRNEGWVSVGADHNTAMFAVATIERWWDQMGSDTYPNAGKLLILADGGGSNGSRSRLWKAELQALADKTGLEITVCHFPPGTSKWNHIEHKMFSFISQNWRGKPLVSHEVMVQLIANTSTKKGLRIRAELDPASYATGLKISKEEFDGLQIRKHEFHGEWNYTLSPTMPQHA